MPTLYTKGNLLAANGDADVQRKLDKYVPIKYVMDWFKHHERMTGVAARFLALVAKTASGKSTVFPAELFINFVEPEPNKGTIICTQPRVLTTITIPDQIVEFYSKHLKLGENMGYSTKSTKLRPARKGLLFATIGTLLVQLQTTPDEEIIQQYRFIIIDEAHERALVADSTMEVLKSFLWRNAHRANCPFVIVTSATIDARKYIEYFLTPTGSAIPDAIRQKAAADRKRQPSVSNIFDTNHIICEGLSQPRIEERSPVDIENVVDACARKIDEIITKHPAPDAYAKVKGEYEREKDDILVFLPGSAEILSVHEAVSKWNNKRALEGQRQVMIVDLKSDAVRREKRQYQDLFRWMHNLRTIDGKPFDRRVILATNVAETGLTLDTLRYVIDVGLNNENEYNPRYRASALIAKPAPRSRITQRIGRVGRKFPGVFYALYTEETRAMLLNEQYPEILTASLAPIILQIVYDQQRTKALSADPYFDPRDLDLLTLPANDSLTDALECAYSLGFITRNPPVFKLDPEEFYKQPATNVAADDTKIGITKLGRLALEISAMLTPEQMRMILAGAAWGYRMSDLINIATYVGRGPFNSKDDEEQAGGSKVILFDMIYADVLGGKNMRAAWLALTGDNFLDGLMFGEAVDRFFATNSTDSEESLVDKFDRWCFIRVLDSYTMSAYIDSRAEIRTAFMSAGFDIYAGDSILYHSVKSPIDLTAAIIKYKHCVYEGFRNNLILWSDKDGAYKTATGIGIQPLAINKIFGIDPDKKINTLISDTYLCSPNSKTGAFEARATCYSVLDGFIGVDNLFSH